MTPQSTRQKVAQYFKDNFDVKKMILVSLALLVFVAGPVIYFSFFDTAHLAWAGIIIATIGKLSELIGKAKEVSTPIQKDGFELFGIGATFFGLLMVLAAATFGFDFKN